MKEIQIDTWAEFEATLANIREEKDRREGASGRRFGDLLFRGIGSSKWGLETTLERAFPTERSDKTLSLLRYYKKATAAQPAIETFSERRWEGVPTLPDFKELLEPPGWLDFTLMNQIGLYEYLVYIRHHGFPSPLLDWTASPYVAAFFAFDAPPPDSTHVSVFGFIRDAIHGGSSDAHLFVVGPYMRAHRRHILQQCWYSMCTRLVTNPTDYEFVPHKSGLADAAGPEGELFKISIPAGERIEALKKLDLMNINAYSLFGSEDSLIRTVSRRECLFRPW